MSGTKKKKSSKFKKWTQLKDLALDNSLVILKGGTNFYVVRDVVDIPGNEYIKVSRDLQDEGIWIMPSQVAVW